MQKLIRAAGVLVALALTACGTPAPQFGYSEFLPNTNEDPAWARSAPQAVAPGQDAPMRNTAPTR